MATPSNPGATSAPWQVSVSGPAAHELRALVRAAASPEALTRDCAERPLPQLRALVESCRQEVERGRRFVVVDLPPAEGADPLAWRRAGVAVLAHLFGTVLPQDAAGALAISVWDRDPERTMADGARYHQTHEGGSIHTDNVNQPAIWDYLVFGCITSAPVGGETILVDARRLHDHLEAHHPEVLATLREDVSWDYRGIKDDVYRAPVISYDPRGECRFRYLRPYLEAAHARTGEALSRAQVYAFDVLDALLQESVWQIRFTLRPGQVLIARDCQMLHGRTGFVDHPDAVPAHQARPGDRVKRTMERYWVERAGPIPDPEARAAADLADRYERTRLLLSEEMYGPGFQSSGGERFLAMTIPHLELQPGDRVLDLGCGTGGTLRYLARHYQVHGTGVDGAADCITMARATAARHGLGGLDFVHADFRTVELERRHHALWTCQSLLYVADKQACLERVRPHLEPGRRSVLADYCRGPGPLSSGFRAYCDACGFELPTVGGFRELVERAGFEVLDVVDYTEWFSDAMADELARLEAGEADFLSRWRQADFDHLRSRWQQKIGFCRAGDMRVAYIVARA